MNLIDRRRYEMLTRVREFGANHGHLFPDSNRARQLFDAVSAAIGQLEAHDLAEMSASVASHATRKAVARKALVDILTKLGQTSEVLAEENPKLEARFDPRQPIGDHTLLTLARKFASEAAGNADEFIAHGMAPAFGEELNALIANFEEALRERGSRRDEQVAARAGIATVLAGALSAVRRLDLIVANHLGQDSVTRAVWKHARRVDYPRSQRRAAKPKAEAVATPDPRPQPTVPEAMTVAGPGANPAVPETPAA